MIIGMTLGGWRLGLKFRCVFCILVQSYATFVTIHPLRGGGVYGLFLRTLYRVDDFPGPFYTCIGGNWVTCYPLQWSIKSCTEYHLVIYHCSVQCSLLVYSYYQTVYAMYIVTTYMTPHT